MIVLLAKCASCARIVSRIDILVVRWRDLIVCFTTESVFDVILSRNLFFDEIHEVIDSLVVVRLATDKDWFNYILGKLRQDGLGPYRITCFSNIEPRRNHLVC